MKTTPADVRQIAIDLRVKQRASLSQIADVTGVSRTTLSRILKDYPLTEDERKQRWTERMKEHIRSADGKLESGPDLSGMRFGPLQVLRRFFSDTHHPRWECLCDCGAISVVRADCLYRGMTRSCGCLARDLAREREQKDPETVNAHSLYLSYQKSANSRGLDFRLSESECKEFFKSCCFYCGEKPSRQRMIHKNQDADGRKEPYLYNVIVRIDSSLGYTLDNCVACCTVCNRAKRDMAVPEFIAWLDRLVVYRTKLKEEE
jgi:hypothetical protein